MCKDIKSEKTRDRTIQATKHLQFKHGRRIQIHFGHQVRRRLWTIDFGQRLFIGRGIHCGSHGLKLHDMLFTLLTWRYIQGVRTKREDLRKLHILHNVFHWIRACLKHTCFLVLFHRPTWDRIGNRVTHGHFLWNVNIVQVLQRQLQTLLPRHHISIIKNGFTDPRRNSSNFFTNSSTFSA